MLFEKGSYATRLPFSLVEMDVAISTRVDIIAGAKVAGETTLRTAGVVVFGEVDGAIGIDAFDPHDMTIDTRSAVGDSMWRGDVVYDIAEAASGGTPALGVTPR